MSTITAADNQQRVSERFQRIKAELLKTPVHLCPERAYLVTEYFKKYDNPREPVIIRKAKDQRGDTGSDKQRQKPNEPGTDEEVAI